MGNNQNFILAIVLSILVLFLWQFLYVNPKIEAEQRAAEIEANRQKQLAKGSSSDTDRGTIPQPDSLNMSSTAVNSILDTSSSNAENAINIETQIDNGDRIIISTERLKGSINLFGGRIDDLRLNDYRETIDLDSKNIVLLSPQKSQTGYVAETGWVGNQEFGKMPDNNTKWLAPANAVLKTSSPVTLTWKNEKGVIFQRVISLDSNYMFTFEDTVLNNSQKKITIHPYGRIIRTGTPNTTGIYVLHEGLIGVLGKEGLTEIDYSEIQEDLKFTTGPISKGWLGITDKYWATALIPSGNFTPAFRYFSNEYPGYQADYLAAPISLNPGDTGKYRSRLFAGAKEVAIINDYTDQNKIEKFDLLIDWGWFHFITKPMFITLDWFNKLLGNFGLAILLTTVAIKLLFFPLANMSYASMAKMKKVQPEMMKIRERYSDDRLKQQQEIVALYKREKINPASGCWPILLQIPVFFALYKVLYITIEMRHAPFFGWIQDLASKDPTSIFNLFGLLPYEVPQIMVIGVWPVLMGVTMFLQMRMNPSPVDPIQATIFNWMPIVFTFMLASFPAGLVIYWAVNNFLSIIQQAIIMRKHNVKIELFDNVKKILRKKDVST